MINQLSAMTNRQQKRAGFARISEASEEGSDVDIYSKGGKDGSDLAQLSKIQTR